jgi:hypothetical protein
LIRGRGAFQRFQNAVNALGFEKKWSRYRDQAYEKIAREWMESNEIAFIDEDQSLIGNLQKKCVEAQSRSTERMKKTPEGGEIRRWKGRAATECRPYRRDQGFHFASKVALRGV